MRQNLHHDCHRIDHRCDHANHPARGRGHDQTLYHGEGRPSRSGVICQAQNRSEGLLFVTVDFRVGFDKDCIDSLSRLP